QGHHDVEEADAEQGKEDRDESELGQGAAQIGGANGHARSAMDVPEPDRERKRDRQRNPERGPAQRERAQRVVEQMARVVPHELEGVDELLAEAGGYEQHVTPAGQRILVAAVRESS